MRIHTLFIILAAALLCGCSSDHFAKGHGDVGQFILQQALVHGGSPATNSLPTISVKWRYLEDKDGVVIRLSRDQYPMAEAYLRQAFGEPRIEPTETLDGGKLGVYRLSAKGGAIQFGYNTKQAQIIIIRPMTSDEIFKNEIEVLGRKSQ